MVEEVRVIGVLTCSPTTRSNLIAKDKLQRGIIQKKYAYLKIKLARKPKETRKAYLFRFPRHSSHVVKLKHGFSGRVHYSAR